MAASNHEPGRLMTEINVTPLVDVVLVLLVIMMVTATALAARTLHVDPPAASNADVSDGKKPLVVEIDERGTLFVDDRRADETAVRAAARGRGSAVVAADGRARHESVVRALDLLRGERVGKIAVVVRAP